MSQYRIPKAKVKMRMTDQTTIHRHNMANMHLIPGPERKQILCVVENLDVSRDEVE